MDTYQEMVQEINERIFNDEFFEKLFELYRREMREYETDPEKDYNEAIAALSSILDKAGAAHLHEAQTLSLSCAKWLARYGFMKGTFAGYQRSFMPQQTPLDFYTFVAPRVMEMPGMANFPKYHRMRDEARASFSDIRKTLPQSSREFLASIEVAWQERFQTILRHSFYLGFRHAFAAITEISEAKPSIPMIADALEYEWELFPSHARGKITFPEDDDE